MSKKRAYNFYKAGSADSAAQAQKDIEEALLSAFSPYPFQRAEYATRTSEPVKDFLIGQINTLISEGSLSQQFSGVAKKMALPHFETCLKNPHKYDQNTAPQREGIVNKIVKQCIIHLPEHIAGEIEQGKLQVPVIFQ